MCNSIIGARVRDYSDDDRALPAGTVLAKLSDEFVLVWWDDASESERYPLDQLVRA